MTADETVSKALTRVQQKAPFFAVLLLHTKIELTNRIETAATDGFRILFNPDFIAGLQTGECEAVFLHEALHCALQHPARGTGRDKRVWNLAADIVVNGIIAAENMFPLPVGAVRDSNLELLSTEEVYAELIEEGRSIPDSMIMDLEIGLHDQMKGDMGVGSEQSTPAKSKEELSAYWEQVIANAQLLATHASRRGFGRLGAGALRLVRMRKEAQLDWRSRLWRFLVRTPSDFDGYDRRFVHTGLYLDDLSGETLRTHLAIDTSGSIGHEELEMFLAEVTAILGSYPHVECSVYYADADLHGPWDLKGRDRLPPPKGGGGTSFVPFFEAIAKSNQTQDHDLLIYLTDGFGIFPQTPPEQSVLWVVTSGGLPSEQFPFGDIARLL